MWKAFKHRNKKLYIFDSNVNTIGNLYNRWIKMKDINSIDKENATLIRTINIFGRVPSQVELLNYIEQLLKIIDKYESKIKRAVEYIKNNQLYDYIYDKEELFDIVSDIMSKNYLFNLLEDNSNDR